jgi:hypothetical protein
VYFKARHVAPILAGAKTDTVRAPSRRLPRVGQVVPASVGPIAPFAWLRITAAADVAARDLPPEQ